MSEWPTLRESARIILANRSGWGALLHSDLLGDLLRCVRDPSRVREEAYCWAATVRAVAEGFPTLAFGDARIAIGLVDREHLEAILENAEWSLRYHHLNHGGDRAEQTPAWETIARLRSEHDLEELAPEHWPRRKGGYAVISDPGGDPWEEGFYATRAEAEAKIDRILADIAAEGLDPDKWMPTLRIEHEPDEDESLSPAETAARLGFSLRHVMRLIDAGELSGEQLPGSSRWKISLSSVLAFEKRRDAARARADEHSRELDDLGGPLD